MLIRITNCKDPLLWYASHIGEVFQVHKIGTDRFWTREPNDWGCLNFVLKEDCKTENYT